MNSQRQLNDGTAGEQPSWHKDGLVETQERAVVLDAATGATRLAGATS